ncbi:methionyl-tRNA formyltransferase [Thiohalobacter thiocyanaticus]|uniref:Methionyl-tRNA formyltransferase n=1 Tax=Thiohalobacter thiocyanaticus TaxID=585455 RepID=A0A426QJE5_9GAMM|nr:methionyl-tRNA formyltransferase [Thiohalobacter thiocyanaticus]RRQ21836.1 methionyl-tRNA formyltransferase [Thiohalobacter thiocyanaticus]
MRLVFAGTPEFSVPPLQTLIDSDHEVVAVYTQPDRPAGRGRRLQAGPVKALALDHGLPVEQPTRLKPPAALDRLRDYAPELMVVVAYGLLLPRAVLDIPTRGCVNIHASLLPRWRGAAPIQRAIEAGDTETGITLMQMDAGLDTGPMLARATTPISDTDTAADLHDRLAGLGARLLGEQLEAILAGRIQPQPQDEAGASYATKLHKSEASIDWNRPAPRLLRQVNAFNPWPVAQTAFGDRTLRIWRAACLQTDGRHGDPGSILAAGRDGVDVACGAGVLRLLEVQLPGGRRIPAGDFSHAQALDGVCLGQAADA